MRKLFIITLILIFAFMMQSCTQRIFDFTIVSTKNLDVSQLSTYKRSIERTEGEDMRQIIIFIPTGQPNAETAIDKAIESVPGAVALLDGVLIYKWFYIPYIYGESKYVIEGTPLINPAYLGENDTLSDFMVCELDEDGNVKKFESVDQEEYFKIRQQYIY